MAHGHDHAHADDIPRTAHQRLEVALREVLVEKGVFTPADMRQVIERMDSRTPAQGARVVARAWVDREYKMRLLAGGSAAVQELGIEVGALKLVAVENTDRVHNVVVCTLCSCYPRMLLGRPPDWYKSVEYRSRVVREPRAVLDEFGTHVPEGVDVRVHDSTADMRYLVIPTRPAHTEGFTEDRLAALVTRDAMIGVARAKEPVAG